MPLSLESRFCGNVYIIRCDGRIVAGDELKLLEAALDLGAHEFTRLVLQVSGVERLDSVGIGLLVRYAVRVRKHGGDLRLVGPSSSVAALLKVTMLSRVLEVFPTEQDAITSFGEERSPKKLPPVVGPRVLVLDESADMCTFFRTVLTQHGFDVKSATCFYDAKILLGVDNADYILLGPDAPYLPTQTVVESLRALAPRARALQLGADFKVRGALEATETLLQMFAAQSRFAQSNIPAS
jgi:anti-anti-sigma factor